MTAGTIVYAIQQVSLDFSFIAWLAIDGVEKQVLLSETCESISAEQHLFRQLIADKDCLTE